MCVLCERVRGVCQSKCPEGGARLPQAVGRGMECPSLAWQSSPNPVFSQEEKIATILSDLTQIKDKTSDKKVAEILDDVKQKLNCLV